MHTELVTSFAGDEWYGPECVQSARFWASQLNVYNDSPTAWTTRLTGEIPEWSATKERLPMMRIDPPQADRWTRKPASYLWQARKFAVKPFVWLDAAVRMGRGLLVWLDADTVTQANVPRRLIAEAMDAADVAYLGRRRMHPETGLVIFRIPEALPLLRWCREAYVSGSFQTWTDGWTDCHALRAGLAAVPTRARDLTSHRVDRWSSGVDAFQQSPFGPWIVHLKGARKRVAA